jgi:hypothetical protein
LQFFLRESKTFFTHPQLHLTLGAFGFGIGMTASLPFSVGDYPQPQLESQVKLLYSNRCSTQVLMPELPGITIYIESLQSRIVGQPLERIRIASP